MKWTKTFTGALRVICLNISSVHTSQCASVRNAEHMKIQSNQIIYYASYSYANDKKFNLVLIVSMCVYARTSANLCIHTNISSSLAIVTMRSINIIVIARFDCQMYEANKISLDSEETRHEREKSSTTLKKNHLNSCGCEQIHRMHYTTFYSHSVVCQHNSKYRHSRHSFIHSKIAFFPHTNSFSLTLTHFALSFNFIFFSHFFFSIQHSDAGIQFCNRTVIEFEKWIQTIQLCHSDTENGRREFMMVWRRCKIISEQNDLKSKQNHTHLH